MTYDSVRHRVVMYGGVDALGNIGDTLYEWDGNGSGAMRRLNVVFSKKMKPEGLTRGSIGGRDALVIVDDGGGFQVIWEDIRLP